jgi:BMFP domain-containing protein YqiC
MTEATHDDAKSREKGRPVYVDVDIIEIRIGRDTIRRPVIEADKRTYAAQYLAFKKSESQEAVEGFPLAQWAAIPGKAVVKEFAHYGIRTVEQLAEATDTTIHMVGPHMSLRQLAKDWVANSKQQGPLIKLRAENESLRGRVDALEKMMARQTQEIEKARQAGGVLAPEPAAPVADGRLAALEAQIAALVASQTASRPAPVLPAVAVPVNGVALNKDGTPRRKPGPKPKVQES